MIARLQRWLCLAQFALPLLSLWLLHGRGTRWAIAAALAWLLLYPGLLALEFVLSAHSSRRGIARPTAGDWLAAWWTELRAGSAVFFWRQPFRARAVADDLAPKSRRGVLFVHGLFCNRGFWTPWLREAQALRLPFMAIDLVPMTGSIDGYVVQIDHAVRQLELATGHTPVLVCHSMGGLAARAWLASRPAAQRHGLRIVTIGTPHAGTWMARFGHGANARQMAVGSAWLRALDEQESATDRAAFVCWGTRCDNVVFPRESAMLDGGEHHWRGAMGHAALAFEPQLMRATLETI